MTDRVCLIGADNAMLDDNFTGDPEAIEPGQRVVFAPLNMDDADGFVWSQEMAGWKPKLAPVVLISIATFMLLFTQTERMAARSLRATNPMVDDFWELMLACTNGIALQHPVVIAGVNMLTGTTPPVLTADRAAQILAGEAP